MGLTIIMGNMFSGKTSELIRRLKRYKVIGKKIVVINSSKDTRSPDEVLNTTMVFNFRVSRLITFLGVLLRNHSVMPTLWRLMKPSSFQTSKSLWRCASFLKNQ